MALVHLTYSVPTRSGACEGEVDFIAECEATEATPDEPPQITILRVREDHKGSDWKPFAGSPLDDSNAYADLEYAAHEDIWEAYSREMGTYPIKSAVDNDERASVWKSAVEKWEHDNAPEAAQ